MDQNKALRVKGFFFLFLFFSAKSKCTHFKVHPNPSFRLHLSAASSQFPRAGTSGRLTSLHADCKLPHILTLPPPLPEMLHPQCLLGEVLLNFQDPTSNVTSYTESTVGIPQDFVHTCETVKWFPPCLSGIKISQRIFQ